MKFVLFLPSGGLLVPALQKHQNSTRRHPEREEKNEILAVQGKGGLGKGGQGKGIRGEAQKS